MITRIFRSPTFLLLLLVWFSSLITPVFSQSDNIPVGDPVYNFLKRMQVQGIITNYDDSILPLTRKQIIDFLNIVDHNRELLDEVDFNYLSILKKTYYLNHNSVLIFNDFPGHFFNNLLSDSLKHLYQYKDSNYTFIINPVLRYKYIYDNELKNNSGLFEFGGEVIGGYHDWLGFYVYGTNGIQSGDRNVALADKRVRHSYTFTNTGRNNFDYTLGYINIVKDQFQIEAGREELLWGNGYINKMIISNNAQPFDFLKFRMGYKSLNYTFLHAWLVQKPFEIPIDKNYGNFKSKNSKYLAISRLQFKPGSQFQMSASQLIIYSNRPLELSYLNPFLFWESAQRSLNDLDNSFLALESRINPIKGVEFSASILFDDINFDKIFKGKWSTINNGSGWQIGAFITNPLTWKRLSIKIDYMQFRPFLFTHPGLPGALTYTNNGELIGADLQPNSTRISIESNFRATSRLNMSLGFQYTLHGKNVMDKDGNLIFNVGGDVFQPARVDDPEFIYLLSGDLQKDMKLYYEAEYQFLLGYYLVFHISYARESENSVSQKDIINFWSQFKFSFN